MREMETNDFAVAAVVVAAGFRPLTTWKVVVTHKPMDVDLIGITESSERKEKVGQAPRPCAWRRRRYFNASTYVAAAYARGSSAQREAYTYSAGGSELL